MSPDFLIALILLSNFTLVATSRVNKAIQIAVIQGVLLGLIPLAMGLGRHPHILFMVAAAITVKGWLIPSCCGGRSRRFISIGRWIPTSATRSP